MKGGGALGLPWMAVGRKYPHMQLVNDEIRRCHPHIQPMNDEIMKGHPHVSQERSARIFVMYDVSLTIDLDFQGICLRSLSAACEPPVIPYTNRRKAKHSLRTLTLN